MTEYEKIQNEITIINNEIQEKEIKIQNLIEKNPIINEYIALKQSIIEAKKEIERYKKIVPYAKMYDCKHIFLITKKYNQEGIEKNIFQCICCGFTNNVPDGLKEFKSDCFKKTRKHSLLISKEEIDYFEAQKIYKEIINDNPNISRERLTKLLRIKINGIQKIK